MFKKVIFALIASTVALGASAEAYKLGNSDFKDGLKVWMSPQSAALPAEKTGFAVEKDGEGLCLAAVGTQAKKDYQLVQTIKLKEAEILGKRVRFGATVKAIKLTGTFEVMIREVQKNGKTIRYRALRWNKYSAPKDWKKAVMEFVPAKPTYILQFYIKSRHLLPGDKVLLKEPFVEISAK